VLILFIKLYNVIFSTKTSVIKPKGLVRFCAKINYQGFQIAVNLLGIMQLGV